MNLQEIESIVELVVSSGVSEVTLENGKRKLTIRRDPTPAYTVDEFTHDDAGLEYEGEPQAEGLAPQTDSESTVTAPMVGIFHYAEPPVGVGTHVESGMVVGIIESMKLMNEVQSNASGYILSINVEAGMAVEYGTILFSMSAEPPTKTKDIPK